MQWYTPIMRPGVLLHWNSLWSMCNFSSVGFVVFVFHLLFCLFITDDSWNVYVCICCLYIRWMLMQYRSMRWCIHLRRCEHDVHICRSSHSMKFAHKNHIQNSKPICELQCYVTVARASTYQAAICVIGCHTLNVHCTTGSESNEKHSPLKQSPD